MANVKALYQRPLKSLDALGEELVVLRPRPRLDAAGDHPLRKEILRLLAEVTLGTGALAVIGGTIGVITALAFFTGTEVGLQGYASLQQIGVAAFAGFVSATSTPARSPRWSLASPSLPRSAAGSPRSSARCGSRRRSTRSRSWRSRRCRSW